MAVYLIRHGETAGNATRTFQTPDVPLNERGLDQARRLADRLAADGIARVVASDLVRARMTAEALASRIGVALELDAGLHERNFGDLRGTPYAALDFDAFAPDYEPPGGESWPVFHARVAETWRRIEQAAADTREGHVAVVTHGLVCHRVVSHHANVADAPPRWGNTALTILDGPPWRTTLLACTAHLEDAAVTGPA